METEGNQLKVPDEALSDSMASEKLTDVGATAADIGLDALISSGVLDGVPIFGALTGLLRAGTAIRDHLFTRKVATFLVTFEKTSETDRKAFVASLEENGTKREFGEQLLILLDRMDDMEKPRIVARVMSAAASGHITLTKAIRLAKIIDRVYVEDLQMISDLTPGVRSDGDVAASLFSVGLLAETGIADATYSGYGGGMRYELNEYGTLLKTYGLKD